MSCLTAEKSDSCFKTGLFLFRPVALLCFTDGYMNDAGSVPLSSLTLGGWVRGEREKGEREERGREKREGERGEEREERGEREVRGGERRGEREEGEERREKGKRAGRCFVCSSMTKVGLWIPLPPQAFFVKDYIVNHPEDGEKIGRLRELMFEQVSVPSGSPSHLVPAQASQDITSRLHHITDTVASQTDNITSQPDYITNTNTSQTDNVTSQTIHHKHYITSRHIAVHQKYNIRLQTDYITSCITLHQKHYITSQKDCITSQMVLFELRSPLIQLD